MKKNTLMRIELIITSVLIIAICCIGIYYVTRDDRPNVIHIKFEDAEDKVVEFNSLMIAPGEEHEFILSMTSEIEDEFSFAMKFLETDGLILKDYVYIRVVKDDKVICDKLLAELFKGDVVRFNGLLNKKAPCEISVFFYMDKSVGNEVENTSSDFDLLISISNEEGFDE